MVKKSESSGDLEDTIQNSDGNVDQIRQILFGGQMRDYEKRFDAIERRLSQSIDKATSALEKKLQKLSETIQSEVEKINEQMNAEQKERATDGEQSRAEVRDLRNHMDSSFEEIEAQLATEIGNLCTSLLDQKDALSSEIQASRDAAAEELKQEAGQLGDTKLARQEMAVLLSEIASRLTDESDSPKSK